MKTVYIAGKVSGIPYEDALQHFNDAERALVAAGYAVMNPLSHISREVDETEALLQCLRLLSGCNAIYMLPDWSFSKGAIIERLFADRMGIEIKYTIR